MSKVHECVYKICTFKWHLWSQELTFSCNPRHVYCNQYDDDDGDDDDDDNTNTDSDTNDDRYLRADRSSIS